MENTDIGIQSMLVQNFPKQAQVPLSVKDRQDSTIADFQYSRLSLFFTFRKKTILNHIWFVCLFWKFNVQPALNAFPLR